MVKQGDGKVNQDHVLSVFCGNYGLELEISEIRLKL